MNDEALLNSITITLLKYHEAEPHAYLEAAEVLQLIKQDREASVRQELNRLEGFLEIAELCEDGLNTMLIWVKNAKWALIAPEGKNETIGPAS